MITKQCMNPVTVSKVPLVLLVQVAKEQLWFLDTEMDVPSAVHPGTITVAQSGMGNSFRMPTATMDLGGNESSFCKEPAV